MCRFFSIIFLRSSNEICVRFYSRRERRGRVAKPTVATLQKAPLGLAFSKTLSQKMHVSLPSVTYAKIAQILRFLFPLSSRVVCFFILQTSNSLAACMFPAVTHSNNCCIFSSYFHVLSIIIFDISWNIFCGHQNAQFA